MARFNPDTYVSVQDRINKFWEENPDGAIRTELSSNPSQWQQVVFRAEVYKHRDNARPDATGYAAEVAGTKFQDGANFTSWHENAETSAIGRAFANMGYATSQADRPSREEMQKVQRGRPEDDDGAAASKAPKERSRPTETRATSGHREEPPPESEEITSWTETWKHLRAMKIATAEEFGKLTGSKIEALSPQEALALAKSCLDDVAASRAE